MNELKRQFRIGDLAKNLSVERFVIRFWEKEFGVKPQRSKGGQRFYQDKDMEKFARIKNLLYEEGFTIAGAKKILECEVPTKVLASKKSAALPEENPKPSLSIEQLKQLRKKLIELRKLL